MFLRNLFYYFVGILFLFLAKAKNIIQGYSTPKPFDMTDTDRCIDYDFRVVDEWLQKFDEYTSGTGSLIDKNVLELGPGTDLGVGLYLLSKGCSRYNACDVNDLMKSTDTAFYKRLFERLDMLDEKIDTDSLSEDLTAIQAGQPSRLNFVVRDDFDIVAAFGESSIDLVFSQAAFEHFDNIPQTVSQLGSACKPGAVIVALIDLQTHSRWIRDQDPNNIYRYSRFVYNLFSFRGVPNRVRPYEYKQAFENAGWTNVSIIPMKNVGQPQNEIYSGLNKEFSDSENQMDYLSIMLCAKKAG